MLVLDEGVAPRLRVLRRHHHPDALHGAILLKLALQLALAGDRGFANVSNQWSGLSVHIPGVEVDPGHKESLEGVAGGFQNCVGVPECNLLLQFVSNLAQFKYKCDKMNIWITVQTLH